MIISKDWVTSGNVEAAADGHILSPEPMDVDMAKTNTS